MNFIDDTLAAEWDELADRTGGATPFHRPGWFRAWWEAFGSGDPEIIEARRDGRLVGVLPMLRNRGQLRGMDNWHTFVFGPVAADDEAVQELCELVLAATGSSTVIGHLMPRDCTAMTAAAASRRCATDVQTLQRSPYVPIDQDFDSYLRGRDQRWLKQLERRRRKLAGKGQLELDVSDGCDDLPHLLDETFRIEALGWKGESGTAITSRPDTERFYRALSGWAAEAGFLRIATLKLDGKAIAADICLEDQTSHFFLKTGFDPELRALAPGLVLRHDMIKRSFDLGQTTYELLGSAERYKLQWTDQLHDIKQLTVYQRSIRGASTLAARRGRAVVGRLRATAASTMKRATPASAR
ncbi:GNAT family N-acetyltransferase [Pseudonocardia sp. TRM90224]|uniref:GNAT family N-acetyltransferase n=1 Tax=Pseudonocardia sp. TRM90224 TaxID=2812678 RepID=UPI001E4E96B5|nr:GNAT family N-acetyltransferase [Pseudonocardia sp. TRM90224]